MRSLTTIACALALSLGAVALASPDPTPTPVKADKVQTGIQWKVAPETVVIHLDDKKLGVAGSLTITETKPGMHSIRLVNGEDETEFDIKVDKGNVVTVQYEFSE